MKFFNQIQAIKLVVLIFSLTTIQAKAQQQLRIYDIPLMDFPFNSSAYPSMRQSLKLSLNYYYFAHNSFADHYTFGKWRNHSYWKRVGPIYLFDFLSEWLPLSATWMHEEWHRSGLGKFGYHSYNDVYKIPLFASVIAVSEVKDEDLIAFKAEHPADFVRMHSAGMEGQYAMNLEIEKNAFFYNHGGGMGLVKFLNYVSNTSYLWGCTSEKTTSKLVNDEKEYEGGDISKRDFTGMDCTAWSYDLHRPFEPYEARGIHPSGIGIDRYRAPSDLSKAENDYLKLQLSLSLLNFVNPMLLGRTQYSISNSDWKWNASLRHQLTPFGYNLGANLFLKNDQYRIFGTTHLYVNNNRALPGIDVELLRKHVTFFDKTLFLSPRLALWMQPEDLLFHQSRWQPGGLAALHLDIPVSKNGLELYAEVSLKTDGWVAGYDYLTNDFEFKFGINWTMHSVQQRIKAQ